jgi:RNA polymerase sigma-70 factor, ECF subfamily
MEAVLNSPSWMELSLSNWLGNLATETKAATSEADLIRAARGGDQVAFGKLVELHKRAVFGVAFRILGPSDAADAAQETFLRAFQRLATFDPSLPFRPWLIGIARHYCLDQLRVRGRQPTSVSMELVSQTAGEDRPPEEAIEVREQGVRIAEALASLPETHREALLLFHQDQLSYRDIAGAMDVPIGTVMTWIHRARRTLKARLEVTP